MPLGVERFLAKCGECLQPRVRSRRPTTPRHGAGSSSSVGEPARSLASSWARGASVMPDGSKVRVDRTGGITPLAAPAPDAGTATTSSN